MGEKRQEMQCARLQADRLLAIHMEIIDWNSCRFNVGTSEKMVYYHLSRNVANVSSEVLKTTTS